MTPRRRSEAETPGRPAEAIRDRSIEKPDPNPASITTTNTPTTDAVFVAPQHEFIAEPLGAFRDADLELDEVKIWIGEADTGLKARR